MNAHSIGRSSDGLLPLKPLALFDSTLEPEPDSESQIKDELLPALTALRLAPIEDTQMNLDLQSSSLCECT